MVVLSRAEILYRRQFYRRKLRNRLVSCQSGNGNALSATPLTGALRAAPAAAAVARMASGPERFIFGEARRLLRLLVILAQDTDIASVFEICEFHLFEVVYTLFATSILVRPLK